MATMQPLSDRIVIQPVEAETQTAGGIIIPDNAKEKPQRGVVQAVGPGRYSESGALVPVTPVVGQVVLYGKYAGTEIKHEGKDLVILRESDVLAIISE